MTMRILAAHVRPSYPFLLGGAARVMHSLLRSLNQTGRATTRSLCATISGCTPAKMLPNPDDWDSLRINSYQHSNRRITVDVGHACTASSEFWEDLEVTINEFRPDLVCTMLEESDRVSETASSFGVPTMLYQMDAEYDREVLAQMVEKGIMITGLSRFLVDRIALDVSCDVKLLSPIFDADQYADGRTEGNSLHDVLVVNPYPQKGIHIVLEIARLLPDIRFRIQESWQLSRPAREWLRRELVTLPNINLHYQQADMRPVYARSSMLLVPSVWEEGFGMVVLEAQAMGIPVIASCRGGLPESVGSGGIVIDDYLNAETWANTIRYLLNDSRGYREMVAASKKAARRDEYSASSVMTQFQSVVDRL